MRPEEIYAEEHATVQPLDTEGSAIAEFYEGKSIFVTGATGFLGKVLTEKLLRACKVEKVYVLCRRKKGKSMEERVQEQIQDVVYDRVRKLQPEFGTKIQGIGGDMALPDLGLSEEDRQLIISKVNIIFHVAATVRFDEHLRLAADVNVKATRDLLLLAKQCKNLKSFVHVSTAFSNCNREKIDEKFYEPPMTTNELLEFVKVKSDEEISEVTSSMIRDWPNTYSFTKAIAESTVREYGADLPVCIVRPSLVVSAYNEPFRAYVDNYYGTSGITAGVGLGFLRVMQCQPELKNDIVPVDYVTNTMIAASYTNSFKRNGDIMIYNVTCSEDNSITYGQFNVLSHIHGLKTPSIRAIWYPFLLALTSTFWYNIACCLVHYLPAVLGDGICMILGKQPWLWKAHRKMDRFMAVLTYFTMRSWDFTKCNVDNLWLSLGETDRMLFPFNMADVDWVYHQKMNSMGVRTYLLKEDVGTIPAARRRQMWLYFVHKTMLLLVSATTLWISYKILFFVLKMIFT